MDIGTKGPKGKVVICWSGRKVVVGMATFFQSLGFIERMAHNPFPDVQTTGKQRICCIFASRSDELLSLWPCCFWLVVLLLLMVVEC